MLDKKYLLNTKQMAQFVADGYLRFDDLVPRELCETAHKYIDDGLTFQGTGHLEGTPFSDVYPDDSPLRQIFELPRVKGVIQSLLGPDCEFDHHYPHRTAPRQFFNDDLHQDAQYDSRQSHFDIQISFFPQDVTEEMGSTLIVPGSHFRRVHETALRRYQNIVGQIQTVCKAGCMIFWHHNLWHSARSNKSDKFRYMYKLRLNAKSSQERHWNTDDIDDPGIKKILKKRQPWLGEEARVEFINRAKLWRYLTGNPDFDIDYYLTRDSMGSRVGI